MGRGAGPAGPVALGRSVENQLLTLIVAIYAMVTLADALSGWLRRRVI